MFKKMMKGGQGTIKSSCAKKQEDIGIIIEELRSFTGYCSKINKYTKNGNFNDRGKTCFIKVDEKWNKCTICRDEEMKLKEERRLNKLKNKRRI